MATAHDVARYILTLCDEDEGDLISNLKLQKLLYYSQGFSLAMRGRPLFSEAIKAWEHGPVIPDVWHQYRDYGRGQIPAPVDFDASVLHARERELVDEVYEVYGQFSAWKLRNMTHSEPPWKDTPRDGVISHDRLRRYFETQVTDDED